jgi:hypothetical protein
MTSKRKKIKTEDFKTYDDIEYGERSIYKSLSTILINKIFYKI